VTQSIRHKWDTVYSKQDKKPLACLALKENQHLLPTSGVALDLACGLGGNALLLAQAGLNVQAWDISPVAINQLQQEASRQHLPIEGSVRDVEHKPPEENSVDVITVSYFLNRDLCSALVAALRPGGLIFYQTYCRQKVKQEGPVNQNYLLKDNELLTLFNDLQIRVYREEALLGDHQQGLRNQALLVAEKQI